MIQRKYASIIRFLLLYYVGWFNIYGKITELAPNGIGLNAGSKYFKVMGPLGETEEAFEEEEEQKIENEKKEETDAEFGYEVGLLDDEESFLEYREQRKLAKEKGDDPDQVKESNKAKKFEKTFKVGKSKRRRKSRRSKRKSRRAKSRTKRVAVEDSDKYWDHAIVPYIFSSSIPEENVVSKMRAMERYHYWSCVRFVPWTTATSSDYGLDHNNYLEHIEKNGCWSFLGNIKSNGQKISCCKDNVCVHELGHSLGLHHEQKSPIHDDYVRINRKNIEPDKMSGFSEVGPEESRTFGYFDMGSVMMYNTYAFSTNGMPTMTLFDSNMEYLVRNPDPQMYYMFKEISDLYHCKDIKCPGFNMTCENNGYVAYIQNTCTCRCPKGLDPQTGCREVYRGDDSLKTLGWPETEFTIMKPQDGCPGGFSEGSVAMTTKKTEFSESYNIDCMHTDEQLNLKFCTKNSESTESVKSTWTPGQYCFFSANGFCPKGFEEGFIEISKAGTIVDQKPIPDGMSNGANSIWHFCCREDGTWTDPLYLPTNEPFTLFPQQEECQEVKDMKADKQWLMIDTGGNVKVAGLTPNAKIVRKTSMYINVCYYWPLNYDCGEVIQMDKQNAVVVIQSPNFPQSYNLKQECTWTVLSPENTKIKLDFTTFDIDSRVDPDTDFPTCDDYLEIRFALPGHPGIHYCGRRFDPTIITEGNMFGLTLFSGLKETRAGFKVVATMITEDEMCYTNRGEDYRGHVNVTRHFDPCLPWTNVQHCPHHAFHPGDLDDDLVDNFCRNPGSGTRPWCYTHYEDCNRDYCDPCALENCYDLLEDCHIVIAEDRKFCRANLEAHRLCRESCGFCEKKKPKPASKVKCSRPTHMDDSSPTGPLHSEYNVGDSVKFKCKTGNEEEIRLCLSDGTWSGANYVCGRCPNGWIPFKKRCYKWFGSYETWDVSKEICSQHSAAVTSAKDFDEFDFLLHLRRDVRPFWLGLTYDENLHENVWLDDGTVATLHKFASGNTEKCSYVHKNKDWYGTACSTEKYLAVICKMEPSERKECQDAQNDCERFIIDEPGACETYPDFAWHLCPKSCNQCSDGTDVTCPIPEISDNVEQINHITQLNPGMMIEYKCKSGYLLLEGNLRRTCLLRKSLTGSEPVCLVADLIPTPNNMVELRERALDGMDGEAYTADNGALRIHRSGKIVRWEFYSVFNGEVAFQVWRKEDPDRYKLIGQNVLLNSGIHRTRQIEVLSANQIEVQEGDMIGFYLPKTNKGGITFDKCISEYTFGDFGDQKRIRPRPKMKTSSGWKEGDVYDVIEDKGFECKVISLRAYVL